MSKGNRRIVIVDLDFTLVNSNTTFHFLEFIEFRLFKIFSKLLKPVILLNKLFRKDFYKFLLVMLCVKGKYKKLLEKYSKIYYNYLVRNNYLNHEIINLVKSIIEPNDVIVLLTASLDIIAENFRNIGFNIIIASKTYYRKNKFHYFTDLYGRKYKLLHFFNRHFNDIVVIEDSPEPEYYKVNDINIIRVSNQKLLNTLRLRR